MEWEEWPVVFVDLDSTLADTTPRHHLLEEARDAGREPDWEAYSLACADDRVFPGPAQLVRMLRSQGCRIIIISGRSVSAMFATNKWLYQNTIPFNELILRPKEVPYDIPPEEFKIAAIKRWLTVNQVASPTLIVEDYPPAKDAMEAEGWTVLLHNPDYDRSTLRV